MRLGFLMNEYYTEWIQTLAGYSDQDPYEFLCACIDVMVKTYKETE